MAVTSPPIKTKPKFDFTPYLFLIGPLTLYLVWIIAPMFYSFYLSTTDWDGISPDAKYIGLSNFETLFGSMGKRRTSPFEYALVNNLKWLLTFITIPVAMGLGLAIVLNQNVKGDRFFKMGIFLPQVLSLPVIGLIWAWVYNPRDGFINPLLTSLGLADPPSWLSDKELVIWAVIFAAAWRQIGYIMILYVAGLKNVDIRLLEAAKLDGANAWQSFRHITFPLLAPVTTIVVVISVIDSLRSFDLVWVMTKGGPANASTVLAVLMYIQAFNNYKMGLGAATAVVLFMISLVFIVGYLWRIMKDEMEY
ncbi:sugar ABC transporter permease [Anaerolineales bacterium HSG25]|nr:sugar ABC transporter permease [Anaerolineales bacterium HSG25]